MKSATLTSIKNSVVNRAFRSLDNRQFEFAGNQYLKLIKSNLRFHFLADATIELSFHSNTQTERIWISERDRIMNYQKGLSSRLKILLSDYHFSMVDIRDGDTIIDCGANVGEIGIALRESGNAINYIAFEPSKSENRCCEKNNPAAEVHCLGLWKHSGSLDFYLKTNSADSSLIEISNYDEIVKINVMDLDSFFDQSKLETVKLLKLEAEGAEPEILEGSINSLSRIEYITVDAGPERGIKSESTLPQVTNFLLKNSFEMIAVDQSRLTALYRNTRSNF